MLELNHELRIVMNLRQTWTPMTPVGGPQAISVSSMENHIFSVGFAWHLNIFCSITCTAAVLNVCITQRLPCVMRPRIRRETWLQGPMF